MAAATTESSSSRPRVLVAGTADAVEAVMAAVRDAADIVPAYSVKEALAELERASFDTIACNMRFDESRMFEFLQAVMERDLAVRIVAFRIGRTLMSRSSRNAIRNALEALGVERFVDYSQLRAEYGEAVALETLRKVVLDDSFTPPSPPK